jgi:hypothetical protein
MSSDKETKESYGNRIQNLIFKFMEKEPGAIFWESFKSDDELKEWIKAAEEKNYHKAAQEMKIALEKGLHRKK